MSESMKDTLGAIENPALVSLVKMLVAAEMQPIRKQNEQLIVLESELKHQRELMEARFSYQRELMEKGFEAVDKRFELMEKQMNKRFKALQWMMGLGFTLMSISIVLIKLFS